MKCPCFLGNEYLGEAERSWAFSSHYFCQFCGEVWARILAPGESKHVIVHRPCRRHWMNEGIWLRYPPIFYDDQRYDEWKTFYPQAVKIYDLTTLIGIHDANSSEEN